MALKAMSPSFGSGGAGLSDGTLKGILGELRGLTTVVVDGAAANTNIAIAGLKVDDHIQSVVQYTGGVPSVLTPSAQTAGNLQFAAVTTGNKLVVNFYKK